MKQSFKSKSPLCGSHPQPEWGISQAFPRFLASVCLGYPKRTRKAATGQPLPGTDLGGPVVQDTGRGFTAPRAGAELKPRFLWPSLPSCVWQLPGAGLSVGGSGCPVGTPSRCRFLRWQRKVLMNHAVVVSPCLVRIGGWEIACHSDFRAILDCKEGFIHQLPRDFLL